MLGSHGTPKQLQSVATSYGGTNPYGQPIYRIVWGGDRYCWKYVGARFDPATKLKTEDAGVKHVHRYSPMQCPRYHVEKWVPPEFYGTPETWRRDTVKIMDGVEVETLGPFPVRGDYEPLWMFEDPDGKYLEPTTDVLIHAIQRNQRAIARRKDEDIIERRREDARAAETKNSENRNVTRELTKEFLDKAMPGRTVRQLKEELTAPRG